MDNLFRRGNEADFAFGAQGIPWFVLHVVDVHAIEEISRPFEARITLGRPAEPEPLDLDSLVERPATLAIADGVHQCFRLQHGIIAEAEEVDRTGDVDLYRVVLTPHLHRARLRQRCRTFVDKTLQSIVTSVLAGTGFAEQAGTRAEEELPAELVGEPAEPELLHVWDLRSLEVVRRVEDPRLRPHVVQYNESDLDFVSRLLEEEGIAYVIEHGARSLVLRLTDRPGGDSGESTLEYRLLGRADGMAVGAEGGQGVLRGFRPGRRLRPRTVTMRDDDWPRSGIVRRTLAAGRRA